MDNQEKFNLITRNLEEVLTEEELKQLISSSASLKHYIGFEISGKVHIGQGLLSMMKVKDLHDAGAETIIFLADWHTWINKKLDGTLETATRMARDYFKEAMKAAYLCVGGNPEDLKFVLGSELYDKSYWPKVIAVSKATTISRMMRSTDITGRTAGESSDAAILIYPAMQAADIFQMGINIIHAGTDQRNVHVVARDVAKDLGHLKPIAIHHHLLQGIKPSHAIDEKTESVLEKFRNKTNGVSAVALSDEDTSILLNYVKMSKSKSDTCIFITDSPEEIKRKVNNAYAPEGDIILNPILDWTKHLIFYDLALQDHVLQVVLQVKRDEKFGGNITYQSYEEVEKDYLQKKLHPQDLKIAVADWLIKKLAPAREYFEDPQRKQALEEIEKLTDKK